jgi:hypothetical protein
LRDEELVAVGIPEDVNLFSACHAKYHRRFVFRDDRCAVFSTSPDYLSAATATSQLIFFD